VADKARDCWGTHEIRSLERKYVRESDKKMDNKDKGEGYVIVLHLVCWACTFMYLHVYSRY